MTSSNLISFLVFNYFCIMSEADTIVYPLGEPKWSSQTFIIPLKTLGNYPSTECQKTSNFYCLSAFETDNILVNSAVELRDGFVYSGLVFHGRVLTENIITIQEKALRAADKIFQPAFRQHNFFILRKNCCFIQFRSYYTYGFLGLNLTPKEYLSKLTNYREENKTLNLIWSYYKTDCNVHIISKIGFGIGKLKRIHRKSGIGVPGANAPYKLKVGDHWTPEIPFRNAGDFLTFKWFKINILCRDQPWICGENNRIRKQ